MKKLYVLVVILTAVTTKSKSQYAPVLGDTTQWCIVHETFLLFQDTSQSRFQMPEAHIVAYGDSIIGTDTFKIMYDGSQGSTNPLGLIREDTTGKVWTMAWGAGTPQLTFDFDMGMGDTIYLDMSPTSAGVFNDGNYTVDSVATFLTRQGPRKYLRLHNPANTQVNAFGKISKVEWVEGLGSLETPLYLISNGGFGGHAFGYYNETCNHQNLTRMLVNKTTDGVKNYIRTCVFQLPIFSFGPDSCVLEYTGSVNEGVMVVNNLMAYPNPSSGDVKIDLNSWFSRDPVQTIEVMDISGRVLLSKPDVAVMYDDVVIPGGKLSDGTYVIVIKGKNTEGRATFIITR